MRQVLQSDSPELPETSFILSKSPPQNEAPADSLTDFQLLLEAIHPLLINSDSSECNKNLSSFLKLVTDYLKTQDETYHTCSLIALKLLNSNLFVKNFSLCLGKILGIMAMFSESVAGDCCEDAETLKETIVIIILLTFKLVGQETGDSMLSSATSVSDLIFTLQELDFVQILSQFLTEHVRSSNSTHSSYVLLNFNCNIFFQYLYHAILLSDVEFQQLSECALVPTLIEDLLSNENFDNYDTAGEHFDDISKLIAYEEFKLLLLINEQYMMKAISANSSNNAVIDGLLSNRDGPGNGICGFTNLLVYHMNREESHIIKIQMLKFLYLILTSSQSAKLPYLNDLKILVDIIIRELNNLDYTSNSHAQEKSILALTYLKILYPLLVNSQLSEISPKYKSIQLLDLLSNVVVNSDINPSTVGRSNNSELANASILQSIVKTATKCLSIPWLRASVSQSANRERSNHDVQNSSQESLVSASSLNSKVADLRLEASDANVSTDSFLVANIASVTASSLSDYNKHTTTHNLALESESENDDEPPINIFKANNSNVFRCYETSKPSTKHKSNSIFLTSSSPSHSQVPANYSSQKQALRLLDLPKEYLSKKSLPPLPREAGPPPRNVNNINVLHEKAKRKKAPPPPPPPPRRRR